MINNTIKKYLAEAERIPNDPAIKHQITVAKRTLKMNNPMAGVMGGMTKDEAKRLLNKYGIKY